MGGGRCEYCRIAQEHDELPFQIEHIVALQHGGPSRLSNLALACVDCNKHKGPNLSGIDPQSRRLVRLYHPRKHKWDWHFRWDGAVLVGRTAIGRATVVVLGMNRPARVAMRQALIAEGVFPPASSR